jgi:hypothetical protein
LFGIPDRASRQRLRRRSYSASRGPARNVRRCRPRSEPESSCPWRAQSLHIP